MGPNLVRENILVQYINWLSKSPTSTVPCCETLPRNLLGMCSIKEDLQHANRVGDCISCSKQYKEQDRKVSEKTVRIGNFQKKIVKKYIFDPTIDLY